MIFRVNGQNRPLDTRDRAIAADRPAAERADVTRSGHIGAPFRGVVQLSAQVGDELEAGDTVAIIEAMKMESAISTPLAGTVARLAVVSGSAVEPGDLIVEVRPAGVPASPVVDPGD